MKIKLEYIFKKEFEIKTVYLREFEGSDKELEKVLNKLAITNKNIKW